MGAQLTENGFLSLHTPFLNDIYYLCSFSDNPSAASSQARRLI